MDLNEYAKGLIQEYGPKVQAGLGLVTQAAQRGLGLIGQDAARGAEIMNDPRNAWIGTNPVGKVGMEGLALAGKVLGGLGLGGMTVYHGSPHLFDKFSLSKIGTGEGAQAYGHGLYFAENPKVAAQYRKNLTMDVPAMAKRQELQEQIGWYKQKEQYARSKGLHDEADKYLSTAIRLDNELKSLPKPGGLYHVDLPDEEVNKMLEWDKPLSEQPWHVQRTLSDFADKEMERIREVYKKRGVSDEMVEHIVAETRAMWDDPKQTGEQIYRRLFAGNENQAFAAEQLRSLGIPGIRYLDGMSRGTGDKNVTYNYVVFDDALPTIKKRE